MQSPRTNEPRCGHCGYDLTGATSNRCPECGLLFIDAGVVVGRRRRGKLFLSLALGALVMVLFPVLVGMLLTLRARAQAADAMARARAAQIEAVVRFQQQMLQSIQPDRGPQSALGDALKRIPATDSQPADGEAPSREPWPLR